MEINKFWLRTFGLAGIMGGLLLFAGDMLFYYGANTANFKLNMAQISDFKIIANGLLALFGSWFYLLGIAPVYYAFKPTSKTLRNIVAITFASILVSYGVVHAAYIAIATSSKLAMQNNLDIETAVTLATQTNQTIRLVIYPIFAVLSYVFIWQVWKKKTFYPRWIILFFPLIPFLLKGVFNSILAGIPKVVIVGGYLNLILVVFFTASTIALWNHQPEQNE